jgi:dethiobiotin synthetase
MQLKPGIFVTGTDTGVGKTIVSATLARLMRLRGVNVGVIKPATSGCREEQGKLISDDAQLLCRAANVNCDGYNAPYLMKEPLAPAEAARIDGIEIDFNHIQDCFNRISSRHDFTIVEGAGGLIVPLSAMQTVADLAVKIKLPLLVVARPNLGTINHTALTCMAARQMGLELAGIIINNFPANPGLAESSAGRYIDGLCQTPLLDIWPHQETEDEYEAVERLANWLNGRPETDQLLKHIGCPSGQPAV